MYPQKNKDSETKPALSSLKLQFKLFVEVIFDLLEEINRSKAMEFRFFFYLQLTQPEGGVLLNIG
jgi:hypothetical protein